MRIYARTPDYLDELILSLPALQRLSDRSAGDPAPVDIWCPLSLTPILGMAGLSAEVIPFPRRVPAWRATRWLRGAEYGAAYLFDPGAAAALTVRLAGIPLRGRAAFDRVGKGEHRVDEYLRIVDPEAGAGRRVAPRLELSSRAREDFRRLVGDRFERPALAIVPGSRARARRWPEGRFTALAGLLAGQVGTVIAFGAPDDAVLAARVAAGGGSRGVDLGGRTSLPVLAAGLAECDLVVANDNGALQLAAAVGARGVGIFGPRSPERFGPLTGGIRTLWHSMLPCAPCGRDSCRRFGRGSILSEARDECTQLIAVEAVTRVVREQLEEARTTSDV
jgi:ADP-heptose:LPS heptosyltransferase